MSAAAIIFYFISALILGAGVLAVVSRKIFRSAIWLLASLTGIAALYFWMEVEFIAAIQIAVYVGGIVVLIIFSIFLTQRSNSEMPVPSFSRILFSALAVLFGAAFSFIILSRYGFKETATSPFVLHIKDIGRQMLSATDHGYVLPFEVVSILLLASMIGCIVIAMKRPAKTPLTVKSKKLVEHE